MTNERLWVDAAQKLTDEVQLIIEFAKFVPGFINLLQDDQIMLLKGGSFEIALLRFCRVFNPENNSILLGSTFVPLEAFKAISESEMSFLSNLIAFAHQMISLKLTDTELALLCSLVLLNPKRPGVKDILMIQRLNEVVDAALRQQLRQMRATTAALPNTDIHARIADKLLTLQLISGHHSELLALFKSAHPNVEFPALHKELFSQEGIETVQQ
jgi:nuclear receptor subfamily 1 group F protein 4